jgi:alpha-glucosidase
LHGFMQVGFIDKLNVNAFRKKINEAETELDGNQPLFVFDNHDRPRTSDTGNEDPLIPPRRSTVL